MILGKGTFGSVTVDVNSNDRAIKQFDSVSCLIREVFATRYIQSDNTVKLIGCSIADKTMTTERWSTSLDKVIFRERLTHTQKRGIHSSILKGLAHLGYIHIVHADLKPSNIFVNSSRTKAVLGDFGLSSISNAARVDLTAPAFSPLTNAKSHCTHDFFGFALVSLELFYGYKVRKILPDRASLRKTINSLVTDPKMKEVLLAMVGDDLKKCMRADVAYEKLYNKKVKKPTLNADIYRSVDEDVKWAVTHRIKDLEKQFFFRKSTRCSNVTISLLSTTDIPKSKILLYASVMSYIFTCVFGRSRDLDPKDKFSLSHIIALERCTLNDIQVCIMTILSDTALVNYIYCP